MADSSMSSFADPPSIASVVDMAKMILRRPSHVLHASMTLFCFIWKQVSQNERSWMNVKDIGGRMSTQIIDVEDTNRDARARATCGDSGCQRFESRCLTIKNVNDWSEMSALQSPVHFDADRATYIPPPSNLSHARTVQMASEWLSKPVAFSSQKYTDMDSIVFVQFAYTWQVNDAEQKK